MAAPPTDRVRELETLLARIRNAGMIQLDFDMWDRWGSAHASPEERARRDADLANASQDQAAAKAALEALVVATRVDAPDEIAAWADAHVEYLTAFLADRAERGEADSTAAFVATEERDAWAEVRAGTRLFVDENVYYVTMHAERYGRLFGIDPQTLERVG